MSKDYSPNVVASSFIKQYYEMMAKHPENLHKFYNEDSFFLHSDLTHQGVSASGPDSIRAAISALNLKNCKVDLSNGYIDAQKSANNGVVVVVVGQVSVPNATSKPFVQSFVLSCQGSSAYYVSNSVFRLLVPSEDQEDADGVLVNLAPPVKHDAAYTQPSAPHTHAWKEPAQPAAAHPVVVHPVVHHEESAATSADAVNAAAVEALLEDDIEVEAAPVVAPVAAAPAHAAPVVAAVAAPPAAPADPFKKLNYSDIVRKANSGAAPSAPAAAPTSSPRSAPSHAAPAAAAAAPAAAAGFSVYVKQVPEAASEADLRAIFVPFGTVTGVDMQVGRSFAFVKFETHAAVLAAVAHAASKPITIHGATLRVEERNSSRGGGSSSGAAAGGASAGNSAGGRNRDRERSGRDHKEGRQQSGSERNRGGDRSSGGDREKDRQGASKGGHRGSGGGNTKAN